MKTTTLLDEAGVVGTASSKKFFPVTRGGSVAIQIATAAADKTAGGTLRSAAPKIFGSNMPSADCAVGGDPNASDITAAFTQPGTTTSAVAITADGQASQGLQAGPLWFAYIAVQFPAPSAGAGRLLAYMNDAGRT